MTNVIQEQSADERKKRQEQVKKEKESQRKAIGTAQKHKHALPPIAGEASPISNDNKLKARNLENTTCQRTQTPTRSRGPYNATDPLHKCHLNDQCHQRNKIYQRCPSHNLDKEEMKIKQKVYLK